MFFRAPIPTAAKFCVTVSLACLVAACGKGPSESDAQEAVVKELLPFLNLMAIPGSRDADKLKVSNFKIGECKDAVGRPGYVCTFSADVNGKRINDEGRFFKIDSIWKYTKA